MFFIVIRFSYNSNQRVGFEMALSILAQIKTIQKFNNIVVKMRNDERLLQNI